MKIPANITDAQLAEAFAALGLEASQVLALSYDGRYFVVDLAPDPGAPSSVILTAAKIPIVGAESTDA